MAPNTTTQSHPGNNSAVSKHTVAAHFISRFADLQSFFDGPTNVFKPKRFLEETIGRFVGRSEPITIVFPGFAMKTPIHGGKVVIFSDGRVFGDLVGASLENIRAYKNGLKELVKEADHTHIQFDGLENYTKTDNPVQEVLERFGINQVDMDARIANEPDIFCYWHQCVKGEFVLIGHFSRARIHFNYM
ncbi:Spore wall maturation protein DIT1 [Phytophthora cinnamomi]|uniref:Spore wall maturation protein DIT1 n=1 Tax=Phytophthora cinnamomi TaxID=4785 RepID=UPI00355A51DF|nr:Spore wall maturation protein DIT1 [Phytophthora cinnamomi]